MSTDTPCINPVSRHETEDFSRRKQLIRGTWSLTWSLSALCISFTCQPSWGPFGFDSLSGYRNHNAWLLALSLLSTMDSSLPFNPIGFCRASFEGRCGARTNFSPLLLLWLSSTTVHINLSLAFSVIGEHSFQWHVQHIGLCVPEWPPPCHIKCSLWWVVSGLLPCLCGYWPSVSDTRPNAFGAWGFLLP